MVSIFKSRTKVIPVSIKPPPFNFKSIVETPGKTFLAAVPNPTQAQWSSHAYWREVIAYAAFVYDGLCAYSATKIGYTQGGETIDHFIAKTTNPRLAYSWQNFRYASTRFNGRKGTKIILDPFTMQSQWFEIVFPQVSIKPVSTLSSSEKKIAEDTISILHLNKDKRLIDERFKLFVNFIEGKMTFEYLASLAPFLASEIKRQGIS
jgi:hypothetical protein